MTKRPVGFIGLGNIGLHMSRNLLESGYQLVAFDTRREPLDEIGRLGGKVASSPAELAAQCDVIQIAVASDAQLRDVIEGGQLPGVVESIRSASIVIVHSTVSPETVQSIERLLLPRGAAVIDCPVSGVDGAEKGAINRQMTFMVAGDPESVWSSEKVLRVSASELIFLGDRPGLGQAAKIAVNLVSIVTNAAVREALGLAQTAGIPEDLMMKAFERSVAACWTVSHWKQIRTLPDRHPGGKEGCAELGFKDLSHAVNLGWKLKVRTPLAALGTQMIERESIVSSPLD